MSTWDDIIKSCPHLYKKEIVFECGKGWFDLIQNISIEIEEILTTMPEDESIYVDQVKEKFGTLRFYMSNQTEEMTALIEEAEALSTQICECCGKDGKMRQSKWIEVRCDNCYKK